MVLGGGPAGATTALLLARAGLDVLVAERTPFPRFHVGESFLPANMPLIRELGLMTALESLPHVRKEGAEFVRGHKDEPAFFRFDEGYRPDEPAALNMARAPFDVMLLDAARSAGAEVREGVAAGGILRMDDGDVSIAIGGEEVRARVLVDASGQAAVIGRSLGRRRVLPRSSRVAYAGHFTNVPRRNAPEGGYITIVLCREGWFWMIPLDASRTSIGLVLDAETARGSGVPPARMLAWAIERCPVMRDRTDGAGFPDRNLVAADFSYTCAPFAGPGHFLVGDSAVFVDPIFSTGVCLGMMGAREAARGILRLVRGEARAERVRRDYCRFLARSSAPFFRLVDMFYTSSFRDLFLSGGNPLGVRRALITLLAGFAFPAPSLPVRCRLELFDLFVRINRCVPIAPRQPTHSLLEPVRPTGRTRTGPMKAAGRSKD